MVLAVKPHELDLTVYGIRQVDYVFEGMDGYRNFDKVVADSAFQQAAAIDEQTAMVAAALKLRRHKSEDLSNALALLDGVLCSYTTKDPSSGDKSEYLLPNEKLDETKALLSRVSKYGLTVEYSIESELDDGCDTKSHPGYVYIQIQRGTAMHAQAEVEQMIDTENNNIQQEMSTLQGFVQKRDKAFDSAAKVIEKYNGTAGNILEAMRG